MNHSRNNTTSKCNKECVSVHANTSQKQAILDELKRNGLRITNQRILIIDIILLNECTCCKEIYYRANRQDPTIGIATVYRMLKTLEEIGVIDRKNLYRVACERMQTPLQEIELELNDKERITMTSEDMKHAFQLWMMSKGIAEHKKISMIYQSFPKEQLCD